MKEADTKPTVYVAGHTGMVGFAISRRLVREEYPVLTPSTRVDLCDQQATQNLIAELDPDWVFLAAARVGGIYANSTYPAEFIYQNLMIESNVIEAAYRTGVKKLMFLGSSCIYPRDSPQPIKEEYLLGGYLEPTNQPYAVAKIAGIVMVQSYRRQYGADFISAMPTNLYGPYDNFDLHNSHVIPAILRKTHQAKQSNSLYVDIWGSGEPKREFMYVCDLADACVFLMENYSDGDIVNIGTGEEVSIRDLAFLIKEVVGFRGDIRFNAEMPDGMPRKLVDSTRLSAMGWKAATSLKDGIEKTYGWFLENEHRLRA